MNILRPTDRLSLRGKEKNCGLLESALKANICDVGSMLYKQ